MSGDTPAVGCRRCHHTGFIRVGVANVGGTRVDRYAPCGACTPRGVPMKLPLFATTLAVVYVLHPHPLLFVALGIVGFVLIWQLYRTWDDEDRVVHPTGIPFDALYRDDEDQR